MYLQTGSPAEALAQGTLGYGYSKTVPAIPASKTIQTGIPALAESGGTLGVTYSKVPSIVLTPITVEVLLERKRVPLTLHSRSLNVELTRKRLKMEVKG
ncbi:hypothetical protein [Streptomyces albogriseolus]|uniref:hypothetical protein n=1 Tax=Streptomyces albogriseolus TaxID=1887 RepID=UPI0036B8EC92